MDNKNEVKSKRGKFITNEMIEAGKYRGMEDFIQNAMEEAKTVIRHYKEYAADVQGIETRRKSLIENFDKDPLTGTPIITDEEIALHSERDRNLLLKYRADRRILDQIAVVLDERMSGNDAVIMRDICENGLTIEEAADKYGVSRSTVIRAREKMKRAYCDELLHRFAMYTQYPADDDWNVYVDWKKMREEVYKERCQVKSGK